MDMKYHLVWFAVLGHIFTDINQGIIPTLVPFFISEYSLTYTAAAGLVSASSIASTVIQPLFGYYSDRFSKPWFIPIGVLLAGYGVALCGSIANYWFSIFMIVISGIGIAAFHPEGARLVHNAAGEKKATGISIFGIGGRLADKYGYRNVILSGFGALIPLLFSFALFKNVNVATVLLIPIGIALISTYSPLVVLGQKYLPNRIGFASGITLGVAVAIGGIVAPLLGSIADGYGIPVVLIVLAILPVLAVMLSIMLTPPRTVH